MPELESILLDLVRIPSPSGNEADAAEWTARLLAAGGLDVQRFGPNDEGVFARLEGGLPGPALFLNSHLDTVPAGEGWKADPWDVDWTNDRLVGLGANDAKSSVAAMCSSALELASDVARGERFPGELWLGFTFCEETSNAGMTALIEILPGRPDASVTGEPTGLEVVRSQAGLVVLEARWHGRACHAAHVERVEHENALTLASTDLARLGDHVVFEGEHPLLGASTLVPTVLRAGTRHNVVPDLAEAELDARLAAPHDANECLELLAQRMPRAELHVRSERLKPVETPADHPLVVAALRSAERASAIGSNTMSDMALLSGIPAIKCGPGETRRSHTANEYVTRDELAAGARFYRALVPSALAALAENAMTRTSS